MKETGAGVLTRLNQLLFLCITSHAVVAVAQIADKFINPLEGGWPLKCSAPRSPVSNCMIQGFGRAVDDSLFKKDSGWFSPYYGYHLAYDVDVFYSSTDLTNKQYRRVFAPANGRIHYVGVVVGYTVVIQFDLPPGDPDGPSVTGAFYHMLQPGDGGITLNVDQKISLGETIGFVSPFYKDHQSRPHQHFGIRKGAYEGGKDPRTGRWRYPGYTTICAKNPLTGGCATGANGKVVSENDKKDVLHEQIISQWFDPYDFLARHVSTITCVGNSCATELFNTQFFQDPSLVAYYRLEDTADSKGANTLTNHGSVSFTAAKFGSGGSGGVNNAGKYLSAPSNLGIGAGPVTISAWFNPSGQPGNNLAQCIACLQDGASKVEYVLEYQQINGVYRLGFVRGRPGVGGPEEEINLNGQITIGTWHHLALTYDGTVLSAYLDGSLIATKATSGLGTQATSTEFNIMARNRTFANEFLSGIVDDVAVFNRALTAAEVAKIYGGN